MKKRWRMFCAVLFFALSFAGMAADQALAAENETAETKTEKKEKTETSITDNGNGTFDVVYDNTEEAKIIVMVSKDGVDYKYFLSNGVVTEVIPLTLGNGEYKIRICKNISGTKYSVIYSETMEIELEDETVVFTNPNIIVDYETKEKAVKKAGNLCKKCKTDTKKITAIYKYLVENYTYDYAKVETVRTTTGYIPSVSQTYNDKMGICYDISSLFAAMLRSQGITTKVVTGYTPAISTLHAWNEVYDADKDKWYVIDVTSDIAYYQAGVSYTMKKKQTTIVP